MIKRLVFVGLILATLPIALTAKEKRSIHILSSSDGFLYIKFDQSMYGGFIEVRDKEDRIVILQDINSRRMLVDFSCQVPGKYSVKIAKNDNTLETFSYTIIDDGAKETVSKTVSKHGKLMPPSHEATINVITPTASRTYLVMEAKRRQSTRLS